MSSWVEALEARQHLTAAPDVLSNAARLVFTAVQGTASKPQSVTLTNRGRRALALDSITLTGPDADKFAIRRKGLPASIAPGKSLNVRTAFAPTDAAVRAAQLEVRTNDPDTPVLTVALRGLGASGHFETAEPSLQRVLDALQVSVDVGDSNPATSALDGPQGGEELAMPLLKKAGPGPVRVTVMAAFTWEFNPVARIGWYRLRGGRAKRELLTLPEGNGQTLLPRTLGTRQFDPGSVTFGLYAQWPSEDHPGAYSEDVMNTWPGVPSGGHAVRFYPFRKASGRTVPGSYIVAMEQAANRDFQDVVLVIENVMPADAVLGPSDLVVSGTAPGSVTLSWTDGSDDETSFVIERSRRKSGVFEVVGSVGAGVTNFTDGGVASGRRYYYRVRAINGPRTSPVSNRVAAVVP